MSDALTAFAHIEAKVAGLQEAIRRARLEQLKEDPELFQARAEIGHMRVEIVRLRNELQLIANADLRNDNFKDDEDEFRLWAQNRARDAVRKSRESFP